MTVVGSGLGGSTGIGAESTYGTGVAPTRWLEMETNEMKLRPVWYQGKGIAAGSLTPKVTQNVLTNQDAGGTIKSMMFQKGMGLWLANAQGSTATPIQDGGTASYTQTHNLGSQSGIFDTIQGGVPDTAGAVHPYTLTGGKISDVTYDFSVGNPVMATWTVDGQNMIESQSFTAASYQTANPEFHFGETNFLMGTFGSEAAVEGVRAGTVTLKRPLDAGRFYADGTGLKQEPIQNGMFEITGTLDTDLIDKTKFVDLFVSGASKSIIFQCTGPIIASSFHYTFEVNVTAVRFSAETPTITGPTLIQPKITFEGRWDETNNPLIVTYRSTDTVL
jgi:hypothetical protein